MRIAKVEYRLFEHDLVWLKENQNADFHDIDREICVSDEAGKRLFISWVQNHNDFHLEWNDKPFFMDDGIVLDYSDNVLWSDLIDKDTTFSYEDQRRYIVKLAAIDAHVFLCAYTQGIAPGIGIWGFDGIHVSKTVPNWYEEQQ